MHKVFLGVGGNLGNKSENLKDTFSRIEKNLGKIIKGSSIYESPPWGFQAKENFWNQVLIIETEFTAEQLLDKIHTIEKELGRKRNSQEYSSRPMDIDILYFDDLFFETEALIIPHPKMHQRLFVLVPLAEIAPDFKHPLFRLNSIQMLENCKDESVIKKVTPSSVG